MMSKAGLWQVKTLAALCSSYHGDSIANSCLFLNSSGTVINVISIDLVPFCCSIEKHFRFKDSVSHLSCIMLIIDLQLCSRNVMNPLDQFQSFRYIQAHNLNQNCFLLPQQLLLLLQIYRSLTGIVTVNLCQQILSNIF